MGTNRYPNPYPPGSEEAARWQQGFDSTYSPFPRRWWVGFYVGTAVVMAVCLAPLLAAL